MSSRSIRKRIIEQFLSKEQTMNYEEAVQPNTQEDRTPETEQQAPREWIEPTFERMTLKEAMSGGGFYYYDGPYTYS